MALPARPGRPVRRADHGGGGRRLRRPDGAVEARRGAVRGPAVHHPGPSGRARAQHRPRPVRRRARAAGVRLRRRPRGRGDQRVQRRDPVRGQRLDQPEHPGYNEDVADDYPYDPEKAVELLEDAGWTELNADGYRRQGRPGARGPGWSTAPARSSPPRGPPSCRTCRSRSARPGSRSRSSPATRDELFVGQVLLARVVRRQPGYWTSPTSGVLLHPFRQNLPESPNFSNSTSTTTRSSRR